MIPAQQVVELALAAATVDETIVIVTDRAEASLRWAGNSMTTNGVGSTRTTTVISIVRTGNAAHTGAIRTSDVDPAALRPWWPPPSAPHTPRRRPVMPRHCSPVGRRPMTGTRPSRKRAPRCSPMSPNP